jgi:hypothetical protein
MQIMKANPFGERKMARGNDSTRVWNVSCEDCGTVIQGERKLRLCFHCDTWFCNVCQRSHEGRHGVRKTTARLGHAEPATARLTRRPGEIKEKDSTSFA